MLCPYSKYNDEADTEAHVRSFLMTWQANHVFQRLSPANTSGLKIAEFGLSLEWQYALISSYNIKKDNLIHSNNYIKSLLLNKVVAPIWQVEPQGEHIRVDDWIIHSTHFREVDWPM